MKKKDKIFILLELVLRLGPTSEFLDISNLLPLQKLKFKFSLNMLIEGQLILPLTETETSIQYNVVVKLVT